MTVYTEGLGRDFWYQLDNDSLFNRTPAFDQAISRVLSHFNFSLDGPFELLSTLWRQGGYPERFRTETLPVADGFVSVAQLQQEVFQRYFDGDPEALRLAFEDFAQGTLYDDRAPRPQSRWVHKMDGIVGTSMVGYHRWHGFIRGAIVHGADEPFWEQVDRFVGLAWAIQCEMRPQDVQNNPRISEARLNELRQYWLGIQTLERVAIFVENPRVAPVAAPSSLINYEKVQAILRRAAAGARPIHSGHGAFWELPYGQFVHLDNVYGYRLIAEPGEDRGNRSALLKVLRGELPNIPRMPLNRPPISDDDIEQIRRWIDGGLAES